MTLLEKENLANGARPRQLFFFSMDNQSWAYAGGPDTAVLHLGVTYTPEVIALEAYTQSLNEQSPVLKININADADVCSQFVGFMPVKPMYVRGFKYDEDDDEYRLNLLGEVASNSFDETTGMCALAVNLSSSKTQRNIPWPAYQKPCNRSLYETGCDVNREDYRVPSTLTSVVGTSITAPEFATKPDGWFLAGYVKSASGEARLVVYHEGPLLVLQAPFFKTKPGEDADAYAGCDLRRTTCKDKFNNFHRWMGFAWVPSENPFTSNVFGPNPIEGAK